MSPLPRSLTQPFRKNTIMVGAGWRAFFAPYDAASAAQTSSKTVGPKIVDLSQGPFDTGQSMSGLTGFFDLGWIRDFAITTDTKIGQIRAGFRGAVAVQVKGQIGESFEFKFREYGRLQMKCATGQNVINLIPGTAPSTLGPLSATGGVATAMTAYTPVDATAGNAPTLTVPSTTGFAVGNYVVCDIDYNPATYGLVGDAMTPVFPNVVTDVDYIRKNSDYVARIKSIAGTKLVLDQPFAGGGGFGNVSPQAGSRIQKIVGWACRDGGAFVSEWTGMFLLDTQDSAQIAVYYPHISILTPRNVTNTFAVENIGTTDTTGYELDAQYAALAFDDPLDGDVAVGYKAMILRPNGTPGY